MNTAQKLNAEGCQAPARRLFRLGSERFVLLPIGPADPGRIARAARALGFVREFDADRWVAGLAVARPDCPTRELGFYAVAHRGDPTCLDDVLIFVVPSARGLGLSHLLMYGLHLELLRKSLFFRLRATAAHPRLRLLGRCGFAPPVRPLVDGKVEVSNYDLHALLARIEAEDEIAELADLPDLALPRMPHG